MMVGHGFIRHAQHEDKPRRRPAANRGAIDVVVVDRAPGAGRAGALLADTFPSFLCDRQTLAVAIGGARAPRGMMARRARRRHACMVQTRGPGVQGPGRPSYAFTHGGRHGPFFLARSQLSALSRDGRRHRWWHMPDDDGTWEEPGACCKPCEGMALALAWATVRVCRQARGTFMAKETRLML